MSLLKDKVYVDALGHDALRHAEANLPGVPPIRWV